MTRLLPKVEDLVASELCKPKPKHLHNVETRVYCPQMFLSFEFQCRDGVSELYYTFWDCKEQKCTVQAYKGSASPRARWGHIHLQLAHRFAQARHRRHLSALLNHWLSFSRHRQHQQNKLQQFGVRRSRRVLLACIKGWAAAVQNRRQDHLRLYELVRQSASPVK